MSDDVLHFELSGGVSVLTFCPHPGQDPRVSWARGLVANPAKRAVVFERDGWKCRHCGRIRGETYINYRRKQAYVALEVGSSDLDNLQTLCSSCNGRKGAK